MRGAGHSNPGREFFDRSCKATFYRSVGIYLPKPFIYARSKKFPRIRQRILEILRIFGFENGMTVALVAETDP